ncbi:MAG: MYG1 family protein [Myxococcota bacterium]
MYHVATHSGKFHADDVLAFAMLKEFLSPNLSLTRTRDMALIEKADIVFDVGGIFNPENGRFDHHQKTYEGPLSSAGMVLNWLESEAHITPKMATTLRERIVNYVDDVDNGRLFPNPSTPCFSTIVDSFNHGCNDLDAFNNAFVKASQFAQTMVRGFKIELEEVTQAKNAVKEAMLQAEARNSNMIILKEYIKWKPAYFELGGAQHQTEFIVFPTLQNTYQCVAISPEENSFAQKRSFPTEWAGLVDDELSAVCGVHDAVFCHKNRFLFICKSQESVFKAMKAAKLLTGD